MDGHYISSVEELKEFYDPPSGMVMRKQIDYLDEGCRTFLAASPFFLLATFGVDGADCSPRGDGPGFVGIEDDGKTLLIPDRAGNNRIDSLRNIVENPRVGLLFLVPGVTYTLRVNGTARLSVEPGLIEHFAVKGKAPRSVIVVSVEEAFTQCARALLRADLWNPDKLVGKGAVPSMGKMLAAHTKGGVEAGKYDVFDREELAKHLY
ncbi:MAG: pyridoxamine 5'-phosphate oxidase family protein [Rubrobacteraceae bacterium]